MGELTDPYPSEQRPPESALATGAAYGLLVVLGVLLGVVGSFTFSWAAAGLPMAAVLLAVVNFAVFRFAGWAMEGKLGAVAVAAPWLIVVVLLSSPRPEGDLIVTGTLAGYLFIFGGSIAAVAAMAMTRSPRPWMLRGAPPVSQSHG